MDASALLKGLSPTQTSRLMKLLDESLDLDPAAREAWLDRQATTDPDLTPVLRHLLAAQGALHKQGFLETLVPLDGPQGDPDTAFIGKQFGPYRIISLLGRGGMGSVWLAERVDGLFSRQVALKLIQSASTGMVLLERFSRERNILAALNHPNIARLFDAGFSEDGRPYLALEYIAGTPLKAYCDEHWLSTTARLELFRQVLTAVQYAHARLVIHRDLKPSNILVSEDGQVHLLDFGIAKLLGEGEAAETELTRLGGHAMTPDYASPEQIAKVPVTIATDVYSLGVMLYELLTGERPYLLSRDTRGALEEAILHTEPLVLSRVPITAASAQKRGTTAKKLIRTLRGDLETIVHKTLKKAPAERYATAAALSDDIGRYLRGDVVLAQRDSFSYRAVKYARRHRIEIAVASVLLLTLLSGLAATSYEARVASRQRDAALEAQSRSLTQTAAARVRDGDAISGLGIIQEVLAHQPSGRPFSPEALGVFQDAQAADREVLAVTGHSDRVRSVAYSPDGTRLVTSSDDKTARVWDAVTGKQLLELAGHEDRLRFAVFSPDGKLIATAALDKTARIWEADTGKLLLQLKGHTQWLRTIQFSPDGNRVVTASVDGTARVWDAHTGQPLLVIDGHINGLTSAGFSPDGRRIVITGHDPAAYVMDSYTGREVLRLNKHTGDLNWASFSPDGARIVTASFDTTARVWDAQSGAELAVLSGHTEQVQSGIFSPDGKRIVTCSDDRTTRLWDAASGRLLGVFTFREEMMSFATFSPDGTRVATSSDTQVARLWDTRQPGELTVLSGHTQVLPGADYSADGKLIGTASADKTARIWDAATGRELMRLKGHGELILSTEFSPDNKRVVTASNDNTAAVWDVATGQRLMELTGHLQAVESALFSPDGKQILTSSFDKTMRIWDATTAAVLLEFKGHAAGVNWAGYSPDGKRIVSASFDKTARIWDVATGHQTLVLNGHSAAVATAAFSPDGKRVVTASDDKTVRVWDANTGEQILNLTGHDGRVNCATFSPDGKYILTAAADKTARVWDAQTGQQLMVARHPVPVFTGAYSPDGRHFVTAAGDNLAHIWEVRIEPIDVQILWARAAQFDPLADAERFQLGLPPNGRSWPDASACDTAAAAPYDPDRRAGGVGLEEIVADIAITACSPRHGSGAAARDGAEPRTAYQHGRALLASGDIGNARKDLEQALALGYRAAGIELAALSLRSDAADPTRAVKLYRDAWEKGVTVAGFHLGQLYEKGVRRGAAAGDYLLTPDTTQAWAWYQKAGDAGDPNALARLGQRVESSESAPGADDSNRLLEAFKYYAAAAERARAESWPESSWRDWRYRRVYLARRLARSGRTREVAQLYAQAVTSPQTGHPP